MAYPVWDEVEAYLAMRVAVMPCVATFALASLVYSLYLLFGKAMRGPKAQIHRTVATVLCVVMVLPLFTAELGVAREIAGRYLRAGLPLALWVTAWVVMFLFLPYWKPLEHARVRLFAVAILLLAPGAWNFLPLRVAIVTAPVVFVQQDGLVVAWGTNMRSTSRVDYGPDPLLGRSASNQVHGLKVLGERLQQVYVPGLSLTGSLYFRASSQGVFSVLPSFAIQRGKAESEVLQVDFPNPDDGLSFVAFSDLHEQRSLHRRMATQIDWAQMEMVVYLGDLINFSDSHTQAVQAMLDLPTGGTSLPRVYLRGNHETRGEMARQLSDLLLPPGGKWYYTFQVGDVFFIALDSGEDKGDSSVEYAGLTDFGAYHRQQAAWLQAVFESPAYRQARQRVVLVHIPPFVAYPAELAPVMDLLNSRQDVGLVMSGHIHNGDVWLPEETGLPFPVTTCGGSQVKDMAAVVVHLGADGTDRQAIDVKVMDIDGKVVAAVRR